MTLIEQIIFWVCIYVIVGIITNIASDVWFYGDRETGSNFYRWDRVTARILLWWVNILRMIFLK